MDGRLLSGIGGGLQLSGSALSRVKPAPTNVSPKRGNVGAGLPRDGSATGTPDKTALPYWLVIF